LVTGAGVARVVVTDLLGRQKETAQRFYVAPRLLKRGVADYALDLGALRTRYGQQGDAYGDGFGAFTYRRGMSGVTIEARGEASREAQAAGVSLAGATYLLGEGAAAIAFSHAPVGEGVLTQLGWSRRSGDWGFAADLRGASAKFRQAGVDRQTDARRATLSFDWRDPWRGALSFGAIRAVDRNGERTRAWNLAYSRPLKQSAWLNVSVVGASRSRSAMSISLSAVLGPRRYASAQYEDRAPKPRLTGEVQQAPPTLNGVGWRVSTALGADSRVDGAVTARAPSGQRTTEYSRVNDLDGYRVGARGAVAFAGGKAFATRESRGAFALVDTYPGMEVLIDNRPAGRTARDGLLLVPDLRANETNRLSIVAEQAPMDHALAATDRFVRPSAHSGALVRFKAEAEHGRWATIVDEQGRPAPEGTLLTRDFDGAVFFVAEGGRAYVAATQHAQVLSGAIAGAHCRVDLASQEEWLVCAPG
jgi:outer membrane usher protein